MFTSRNMNEFTRLHEGANVVKLINARRDFVICQLGCCCELGVLNVAQLFLDVVIDSPRSHRSLRGTKC